MIDSIHYLNSLLPQVKAWLGIQCKVYLYSSVMLTASSANTQNYIAECLSWYSSKYKCKMYDCYFKIREININCQHKICVITFLLDPDTYEIIQTFIKETIIWRHWKCFKIWLIILPEHATSASFQRIRMVWSLGHYPLACL